MLRSGPMQGDTLGGRVFSPCLAGAHRAVNQAMLTLRHNPYAAASSSSVAATKSRLQLLRMQPLEAVQQYFGIQRYPIVSLTLTGSRWTPLDTVGCHTRLHWPDSHPLTDNDLRAARRVLLSADHKEASLDA